MPHSEALIIQEMVTYLKQVIEKAHPAFGEMPICPFSRKARLANKIRYQVHEFSIADLEPDSHLLRLLQAYSQDIESEVLLVIHPIVEALSLEETHNFVEQLNLAIAPHNLIAFDGHPQDDFNIHGVYTRKAPYIHITVQNRDQVKQASDALMQTAYYHQWSRQHLAYVGLPNR